MVLLLKRVRPQEFFDERVFFFFLNVELIFTFQNCTPPDTMQIWVQHWETYFQFLNTGPSSIWHHHVCWLIATLCRTDRNHFVGVFKEHVCVSFVCSCRRQIAAKLCVGVCVCVCQSVCVWFFFKASAALPLLPLFASFPSRVGHVTARLSLAWRG